MCGISGEIRFDGVYASTDAVGRMTASMADRGPDGSRIFATTSATLATGRLTMQMVGADHAGQEGVVAVDDVVVKARS